MKERPILFSCPMVRAILDGKKTQTRRVVKPQPAFPHLVNDSACTIADTCPYGQPGDQLWVRETWRLADISECACYDPCGCASMHSKPVYRADCDHEAKWKPSIHMPRWASRLTLEIVSVRVERLRDIKCGDAEAEGVSDPEYNSSQSEWQVMGKHPFVQLWDSINGKKHPWQSNPWVWVIEFKAVQK